MRMVGPNMYVANPVPSIDPKCGAAIRTFQPCAAAQMLYAFLGLRYAVVTCSVHIHFNLLNGPKGARDLHLSAALDPGRTCPRGSGMPALSQAQSTVRQDNRQTTRTTT